MLGRLSIIAAIAALLLIPVSAFARGGGGHGAGERGARGDRNVNVNKNVNRNVNVNKNVNRNVNVSRNVNARVGGRYYGGVWYGTARHYWNGQWYDYGVGP